MKRLFAAKRYAPALATPLFVDEGNRACVKAIHQVASGARHLASPLVFVGPEDSGKTRLLLELEKLVSARGGVVMGGAARDWTARLREALRTRSHAELVSAVSTCDLLVIDEFHRLGTARATREFLVHRIAERLEACRATAVATRHAPRRIRGVDPRSASILLGGLVLYTARAGPAVRRRYLASISGGRLGADAIERLCASTPGGLRALDAAYFRSRKAGRVGAPAHVSFDRIAAAAAREFEADAEELLGRRKLPSLARAREALVFTAVLLGASTAELAGALDGRGRAAVGRILERARARSAADPNFRASLERLAARLRAENAERAASEEARAASEPAAGSASP